MYRETSLKARPSLEASTSAAPIPLAEEEADDAGGMMLAVLAVPSWMTPSDFLTFVAPAAEGISHLRMIRQGLASFRSRFALIALAETQCPTGLLWSLIFSKQLP